MKLHEYLKQFEGLDPDTEVFVNNSNPRGIEREATKLNYCPFQLGFVHRDYDHDVIWRDTQSFHFHTKVLVLL